jgi:acetylglutamate kinase
LKELAGELSDNHSTMKQIQKSMMMDAMAGHAAATAAAGGGIFDLLSVKYNSATGEIEHPENLDIDLLSTVQTSLQDITENEVALSGVDAGMIEALPKDPKLGYVGTITEINTDIILDSLTLGYIPVISTIGFDQNGNLYNINADTAAARIAGALDAEKFIAMTDIKGVLKDKNDPNSLMQTINVSEIKQLAKQGIIDGGMLPKVACCEEAIRRGVNNVVIIDGRVPHSILIEVLTDEGVGTQFK